MLVWRCAAATVLLAVAACSDAEPPSQPSPTLASRPTPTPAVEPTPPRLTDPFALARTYDSATPKELAAKLVEAERTIRSADEGAVAEAAHVQQAAYRQLVRQPEWQDDVYAALPRNLLRTAGANVEAGAELRAITEPRTELPPWKIVSPPPRIDLFKYYSNAEHEFGVEWEYLAAIHLVETRMGRIRGVSTAGARGPMQFLPSTWERWGEGDIEDARDAIRAAARYLKGHGAPGDMRRALFAYNHSDHYVQAIELYASEMRADEGAYAGYYNWQVYYRTTRGDALLPVGWTKQ